MIAWGNWDVRVCAAQAWVALAPRFASDHPIIVDHIEAVLADAVPAVRFQAANNLQVLGKAAPETMWAIAERIAAQEGNRQILAAFLSRSMRRFSHSDPARCEAVLKAVRSRLEGDLMGVDEGRDHLQESMGGWTAQLFVGQGRVLMGSWLEEWAADPERYADLLDSYASALRDTFFLRYKRDADPKTCAICDRAQEGLALILKSAITTSSEAYSELVSDPSEPDKEAAIKRYRAAEKVISHAMNQLYFGSGAYARNREEPPGLQDANAMARFLTDYGGILALLANSREPATLHRLLELYEFLIPGDPVAVFEAIHGILLGRGQEEGYHYETLGTAAVVRIVRRYVADYRAIFDEEDRRAKLVAMLRLFSEVGWPEALKLLYELPDLLR